MSGGLLGRSAVLSLLGAGLRIDPLDPAQVTETGVVLRVGRTEVQGIRWSTTVGTAVVPAGATIVLESRERVTLPPGIVGLLFLDAALAEKGLLANLPVLSPGFDGTVRVTVHNAARRTWDLEVGARFVHLVLQELQVVAAAGIVAPTGAVGGSRLELPVLDTRAEPGRGEVCRRRGCSACCHDTEMPLTAEDVRRLEGMGHRQFFVEHDGWRTLRNVDGSCVFLQGQFCSIYPDRPEGCKLYPLVYDADKRRGRKDRDCPHREEFGITADDERTLARLVDRLVTERGARLRG